MKRIALLFFIICNFIFAFTGKVTKVADGDTITVLANGKSVRVRFYGIDAPEKKQDCGRIQMLLPLGNSEEKTNSY